MIILDASSSAGHRRVRTARPPRMLLLMMAVLEDIFPLDLCTRSTCHLADTSACISTTSWMQQSGVYRRQKSSRLIVVSGELVALSSLAQHRCRRRHAIASPSRWSKTGHTVLRSWHRYTARWLTGLVPFLTRVRAPPATALSRPSTLSPAAHAALLPPATAAEVQYPSTV